MERFAVVQSQGWAVAGGPHRQAEDSGKSGKTESFYHRRHPPGKLGFWEVSELASKETAINVA
jgi:hypothetical protein